MSCVSAQDANSTDLTVQNSPTDDTPVSEILEAEINGASKDLEDSKNDAINASTPANANPDDQLAAVNNEEPLTIIPRGHTFVDIYEAIELAGPGGVVDLEKTIYIGLNPIEVSRSVTINGNGATLDARGIPLIFRIHESNVTIKNITFINCRAIIDGGAVYWSGKNGMLVNCTFKDNEAILIDGGAVYWIGDNGNIVNCNFIDNSAGLNGGAIYLRASNCIVDNCNFTGNTAQEAGGAIYCSELLLSKENNTISNCNFTENTAQYEGGAIYLRANNCKIDNCDFTNNAALGDDGGAIYCGELLIPRENNTISNCNFTENTAMYNGGAIYMEADSSNIINCFFDDNTADEGNGGAIYLNANNCKIDKSGFTENTGVYGGAVYCGDPITDNENNTISNCIFTDNTAEKQGGALYIMESYTTLDLDYFNDNVATRGSAIYINRASEFINISNTEFGRNIAECMMVFIGGIDGNETYALANVTVDVYLIGNDNIANAIWNNGETTSIQLYNITCEFSKDGKGRSLKQFNMEGFENPTDGFEDDSKIWQSSLENAQLIDILVTDENGNVVLNITNGVDSPLGKSRKRASLSDDTNLLVTDTIGKISVTLPNLKAGKYTVLAKHKDDQYYTASEDSDTFVIYEKIATYISVENVTTYPGKNVIIHIKVTTDDNKAFNGNVTIKFPDGSTRPVTITNGNGNVKWFVSQNYIPGVYNDTVSFLGDDTHLASTGNGTITVKSIPTTVVVRDMAVKAGQNVKIVFKVTANNNKPFNGDVTVTLPDGSVKTVKVINGLGKFVWHVPEDYDGTYEYTVTYPGNDTFLPSNATGFITVTPDNAPIDNGTIASHKDVKPQNGSLGKYETGNPILALLAVLSLLGVSIKRKK